MFAALSVSGEPIPTLNIPARDAASIPASASSKTTQCLGSAPSALAPKEKLPDQV